ncbi:MAG: GGDEF domain-containing response regulator [Nitrospira sp.]|nr:GGDEF domain-containing response regulator [Nitrospira sp.]
MLKILLIEDNETDARLTQDILAEWSVGQFDVAHVVRLKEALDQLARYHFDAVLLDLSLPDGYGLATLGQIQSANPRIPVIVLSGLSDQALALQAVQAGAQDYLVKGRSQGELLARSIRYAIERKRAEERLTYLAQYDQLTGLVNRTLFRDRLLHAMARSKRLGQSIGLMWLDLDRFKTVNDTLGHEAGDHVLKAAADRIKACVREVDTVARMGGDEFTVIVEGLSHDADIICVAERITTSMAEPFLLGGGRASIGVSIGITVYPADDHDIDNLLRHADAAMYRAKQQGGNSFEFYTPARPASSALRIKQP